MHAVLRDNSAMMHKSCNDGVIQLSPLSCYALLEVVEISCVCFVHLLLQYAPHCRQLDLNPVNLVPTVEARGVTRLPIIR